MTIWTGSTPLTPSLPPGQVFNDPLSGIGEYEYAIGTSAESTDVLDWTSAGSDTTATPTGLTLSDGITYYTSVHAIDMAGNVFGCIRLPTELPLTCQLQLRG